MTVNGIKLTRGQADVYAVFKEYGVPLPDHALVPLAQHAMRVNQSSSSIRSRRHELAQLGLLKHTSDIVCRSGRKAGVWTMR